MQVEYLLPGGRAPIIRSYTVAAHSRFTIWVNHEFGLGSTDVSATVTSSQPIIVERAMWWPAPAALWHEAHNSPGATSARTKWAVADGEVGGSHLTETYILVAKTGDAAGSAKVTLVFEDGSPAVEKTISLSAHSRTNVNVAVEFGVAVAGKRFGAIVESLGTTPVPIVVERSVYSSANGIVWAAGSNSLAARLQ